MERMRRTRNRQLAKLHNEPMWFWNKEGTDDIRSQRLRMKRGLHPKLDPTFKWIRCYNMPSFAIFTGGEVLSRKGNVKSNRYHNRNITGWIEVDSKGGWAIKIKL